MTGHLRGDARKKLEEQQAALPPRVGQVVTATGTVRTVEALWPDGHYRITVDVADQTRVAEPVEDGVDPAVALWREGWEHHRQHPRPIDPEFGINPYEVKS